MKKTIILLALLIPMILMGQSRKPSFKTSQLLPMTTKMLKNIQAKHYPKPIKKTNKGLMVSKKLRFIIKGGIAFVI